MDLVAALLRLGNAELAKHMDWDGPELSQRLSNAKGWKLEQFAKALVFVGAQILPGDGTKTVIDTTELTALRTLAAKYLAEQNGNGND